MAKHHLDMLALAETGQWNEAHDWVQNHSDRLSCLIHAYLHRVEGDLSNAGYWYQQAGESTPANNLDQELARLKNLAGA